MDKSHCTLEGAWYCNLETVGSSHVINEKKSRQIKFRTGCFCKTGSHTWGLFCSQSLLEMGTKDMDFIKLNQLIGRKTGGISVYPFTSSVQGKVDPCSHIIARGKAMAGKAEDLFNLVLVSFFFLSFSTFKVYYVLKCFWHSNCNTYASQK